MPHTHTHTHTEIDSLGFLISAHQNNSRGGGREGGGGGGAGGIPATRGKRWQKMLVQGGKMQDGGRFACSRICGCDCG